MIKDSLPAESTTVEYKVSLETEKPKSWLKTICAFANTSGGSIVFGVADDKSLIGIDDIDATAEKIIELISANISPIPYYQIRNLEGSFLVVTVHEGAMTPYYYTGNSTNTAYIRTGAQSIKAPPQVLNELLLRGRGNAFDSQDNRKLGGAEKN